jgi:Chaperone of endosialidase
MLRSIAKYALLFCAWMGFSAAVMAQQPPDPNPSSDGFQNSAYGTNALLNLEPPAPGNFGGYWNTAVGYDALLTSTTGFANSAFGAFALSSNTTGSNNTAVGGALGSNTTGNANTAVGVAALNWNSTGSSNAAFGDGALNDSSGDNNTAVGTQSLYHATGTHNTAVGFDAGARVTTGSYNIDIGNPGGAGDNSAIRMGTAGVQFATFIAGIENAQVTGAPVYVTSEGQLGVLASSERYKTAVVSMGTSTDRLDRLRPVAFHLKHDPAGALQYGLIAEEVDKVYPELVIRDRAGVIQGVRYDELAPMLLNAIQQQQTTIKAQASEFRAIKQQLAELTRSYRSMSAAMHKLQSKDVIVAQR